MGITVLTRITTTMSWGEILPRGVACTPCVTSVSDKSLSFTPYVFCSVNPSFRLDDLPVYTQNLTCCSRLVLRCHRICLRTRVRVTKQLLKL